MIGSAALSVTSLPEELKQESVAELEKEKDGYQPTYEELKPDIEDELKELNAVTSLPMRN